MDQHRNAHRPPPDILFEFRREVDAPRRARRALRPLREYPDHSIEESVTWTASELVTNVVTHTHGGGMMRVWYPKPGVPLRLEIEDSDHSVPVLPRAASEAGGNGLRVVDRIADEWGFALTAAGKVAWAEFSAPRRSRFCLSRRFRQAP